MNLSQLRSQIVDLTGYPERGAAGQSRLNSAINYSLRQIWREMPESLMKEEFRFRTEPNISINTIKIDTADPLVFLVEGTTTSTSFATDGTLRGRWLEVQRDGKFYYRRIKDVYIYGQGPSEIWAIVVDEPWDNLTDEELSYKIVTKEYPYPSDVQKIRKVIYDPENLSYKVMYDLLPDELSEWKIMQGYRRETRPTRSTRGDFFVLPTPHYAPIADTGRVLIDTDVAKGSTDLTQAWGYDNTGVEAHNYGPAGTFSYKVIHVWGRRPFLSPKHARPSSGLKTTLRPFYRSSESKESGQAVTTWGGSMIKISTPDIDYMDGYGKNVSAKSYHKNGVEKWIFRARHATESTSNSTHGESVENDGIYYLWRVTPGYTTATYDRGDDDPVDKTITLKDIHGHYHIRFDSYPTAAEDVLLSVVRRPDTLRYDTDSSRLPPECYGALVDLACSYLLGRRDGEPKREGYYYSRYMLELERLKAIYTFSGHTNPSFGEGLSTSGARGNFDYTVQES